jgi:hypothetical protein
MVADTRRADVKDRAQFHINYWMIAILVFLGLQYLLSMQQEVAVIPYSEFEQHLNIDKSRVHVVHMLAAELHTYFPYYDRLTAIRTSKLMQDQGIATGWHINSPQARLAEYNPLVMSKFMLLRDAARLNVWGARYHLWMDAGHLCAGGQSPNRQDMYRKHMARGFLNTHWPYGTIVSSSSGGSRMVSFLRRAARARADTRSIDVIQIGAGVLAKASATATASGPSSALMPRKYTASVRSVSAVASSGDSFVTAGSLISRLPFASSRAASTESESRRSK